MVAGRRRTENIAGRSGGDGMNKTETDVPLSPFSGLFTESDRLAGITGQDVGAEIASVLGLPATPLLESSADVIAGVESFIRRFCVLPDSAYLPLALWIFTTYVADAFDCFPYIALLSPAKRCGKTRVLEVLELLCSKPWRGTSPTSAALYRMMGESPTLLLDEVETLRGKNVSETQLAILAVLNAGHRKGATIPRCDGPKNEVRHFPVYGPKAFAAIGGLPDTLADRSIIIAMQRKASTQAVERFLFSKARALATPIAAALEALAIAERDEVEAAYAGMPDLGFLVDRDADLWMPLFAICAVVSPERTAELKECALTLTGAKASDDAEDSLPLKLLGDIRACWPDGAANVSTTVLLERLKGIEDSPWSEFDLSARKLAKYLRPFGVERRQIRVGTLTGKGYIFEQLEAAFSRYLGSHTDLSET